MSKFSSGSLPILLPYGVVHKNVMTHTVVSNRKNIPLDFLVGINHDMVGRNRSYLPKW